MQAPDTKTLLDLELESSHPSLFTMLTIEHDKLGKIVITAKDIVEIVEELFKKHVAKVHATFPPPLGMGTTANPFVLSTPAEWLLAAIALKKDTKLVYYNIGGKIVDINLDNAYASDRGANEDFLQEMNAIALQMLGNIIQSEDKEKLRSLFDVNVPSDSILNKLGPLIFLMIQQFSSKGSDTRRTDLKKVDAQGKNLIKTLEEPPYSELEERDTEAVDPTPNLHKFASEMPKLGNSLPTAIMADFRRDLENPDSDLVKMLNSPGGIFGKIEPIARSLVTALPPERQKEGGEFIDFLLQGIKAFLPEPRQLTADSAETFAAEKWGQLQHLGQQEPGLKEWFSKDFESLMTFLLNSLGKMNTSQRDVAKFVEFANALILKEIRLTLKNQISKPHNYLPVTLAAWMLCETSRYHTSYIGSLMLLDLIEARESTPFAGETYTLGNAMSHPKPRHSFVDAHGVRYRGTCRAGNRCSECEQFNKDKERFKTSLDKLKERQLKDIISKAFNGDKSKIPGGQPAQMLKTIIVNKAYEKDVTTETVAGYHPMVHKNSFTEQADRSSIKLILSQQKLASLLFQWLCLQLRNSGLKISLRKTLLNEGLMKQQQTTAATMDVIEHLIAPLISVRVNGFEAMNAENDNVEKIIEAFCAKYSITCCKQKLASKETNEFYRQLVLATIALGQAGEDAVFAESEKDKKKEAEEALQHQASQFGFSCKNVSGDGRCFFHALADQLHHLIGMSFTSDQLIAIATEHIFINFDSHYREFMIDHETETEFLIRVSKHGEWADHIMIIALSRALNINIVIVRSDGADPNVIKRSNPLTTVFLGYELMGEGKEKKGFHYQSLHFDKSVIATRNINNYLRRDIDPDNFYRLNLQSYAPTSSQGNNLQPTSGSRSDSNKPQTQIASANPVSPLTQSLSGAAYNPTIFNSEGSITPPTVKPAVGTQPLTDEKIEKVEAHVVSLKSP